jgi:MoaA/NifB/PqqE/SkfB family radical SAM enzyme
MEPLKAGLEATGERLDSVPEAVQGLLGSFLEQGANSITLTGGEPTIRKDFFSLLEQVSETGLYVTVQTNGRLLSAEKAKSRLSALSNKNILFVVAIHASTPALHDDVTRAPGSFAETVKAIRNLKGLGFPICGKMVLSSGNVRDIGSTLSLMASLGIAEAMIAYPHAENFPKDAMRGFLPRYGEVRNSLAELNLLDIFPGRVFFETIPYCQFPAPDFWKFSNDLELLKGRIQARETFIEMSMTGERINWEESRTRSKHKGAKCALCLLDRACEGVWEEYSKLFGDSELTPISDAETAFAFADSL